MEIDVPAGLSAEDRAACAGLVEALPDTLLGQERVAVEPADAPGAAWGDPAVVLSCGVGAPEEYDEFSACTEVAGVGWFVPDRQLEDLTGPAEATALTHAPRVRIVVPGELRAAGVDGALADLGPPIAAHLDRRSSCR